MRRTIRTNKGIALITIIALSAATLIFLIALAAIVSQASRALSATKWSTELVNDAEVGADWAVSKYEQAQGQSPPAICALDPPAGSFQLTTSVPATATSGLPSNVSISVLVKTLTISEWSSLASVSSVYNYALDPNQASPTKGANPQLVAAGSNVSGSAGGVRIIESTATRNGASRIVRVVLIANLPNSNSPGVSPGSPSTSYFSNPMLSSGQLSFNPPGALNVIGTGNGVTQLGTAPNQYYSYNLTAVTNYAASIGSGVNFNGNINVTSFQTGGNVTADIASGSTIDGRLQSNGAFNSTVNSSPGTAPQAGNNVLANADSVGAGVPNSPRSGLNDLQPTGEVSSGNGTMTQGSVQNPITPAPGLSNLPSGTVQSGDYVFDFGANPGQAGTYGTSLSTSSPVRVFAQDTGDPVQINTGNIVTNTSSFPANFQIWYSGTQPVNVSLSGNDFNGLIYAPFSTVTVSGTGNFNGAVVGGAVNFNNVGTTTIRTELSNPTNAPSAKLGYSSAGGTPPISTQWLPVTWQELAP